MGNGENRDYHAARRSGKKRVGYSRLTIGADFGRSLFVSIPRPVLGGQIGWFFLVVGVCVIPASR